MAHASDHPDRSSGADRLPASPSPRVRRASANSCGNAALTAPRRTTAIAIITQNDVVTVSSAYPTAPTTHTAAAYTSPEYRRGPSAISRPPVPRTSTQAHPLALTA